MAKKIRTVKRYMEIEKELNGPIFRTPISQLSQQQFNAGWNLKWKLVDEMNDIHDSLTEDEKEALGKELSAYHAEIT